MSPCPLLRCSWRISSATAYRQHETSKNSSATGAFFIHTSLPLTAACYLLPEKRKESFQYRIGVVSAPSSADCP
jgi:hypothetical protein